MKEKIESTNFNELTLDGANEILNELLTYQGEEFKEYVINIIDSIDNSIIDGGNMNENIRMIFNNERVIPVLDEIYKEYNIEE